MNPPRTIFRLCCDRVDLREEKYNYHHISDIRPHDIDLKERDKFPFILRGKVSLNGNCPYKSTSILASFILFGRGFNDEIKGDRPQYANSVPFNKTVINIFKCVPYLQGDILLVFVDGYDLIVDPPNDVIRKIIIQVQISFDVDGQPHIFHDCSWLCKK